MASTSTTKKMILLRSSDDMLFAVEEEVISESQTIKHLIEDGCTEDEIPLSNVSGFSLRKVIEYCRKHVQSRATRDDDDADSKKLNKWDAAFVRVDKPVLFGYTLAAHYLEIKSLEDLCCQTIADTLHSKSAAEAIRYLNIKNDLSPDEELQEELRTRLWLSRFCSLSFTKLSLVLGFIIAIVAWLFH